MNAKEPIESIPPIHAFFDSFQAILSINLSNRCNVECAHCAVESSPRERGNLDVAKVLQFARNCVDNGTLKGLQISGGEPFLFRKELVLLSDFCKSNNIACAVNTNCFWGRNHRLAKETLSGFDGISQLLLSTDLYHEKFIQVERVATVARIGTELDKIVYISVCESGNSTAEFVSRLKEALGPDLAEKIPIGINPTVALGRAVSLDLSKPLANTTLPRGKCRQVNRPLIDRDGKVFACCNTETPRSCGNSPLLLGSIFEVDSLEINESASSDVLIQSLRAFGPAYLARYLIELLKDDSLEKESYSKDDICSLCIRMMSDKSLHAGIQAFKNDDIVKQEVAIELAAEFGDLSLLRQLSKA